MIRDVPLCGVETKATWPVKLRTPLVALFRAAMSLLVVGVFVSACGRSRRPDCAVEPGEGVGGMAPTAEAGALNPDQARELWESGPHARSDKFHNPGADPGCARCHAPQAWMPDEGAVPASWLQAGVDLAKLVSPSPGSSATVGCALCHQGEPQGIEGEIAWLEVPPALVYSPVQTSTELCAKCHQAADVEGHLSIMVSGSHLEMTCTDCHDPHDTAASCTGSGCHEPFAAECEPIETHDKPHSEASCAACHDADLLPIDWNERDKAWDTVIRSTADESYRTYASHALILEVACERCHEPGNHPWGNTKE